MYKVYKTIWTNGIPSLQYVGDVAEEHLAKARAQRLKGVIKVNDQIWFDFR